MLVKHISVMTNHDSVIELRGELVFDPAEGTLTVLGENGSYATFNWSQVLFFSTQKCEDCEQ